MQRHVSFPSFYQYPAGAELSDRAINQIDIYILFPSNHLQMSELIVEVGILLDIHS